MRLMPLVGVGTAAVTALAGVCALGVRHTSRDGGARGLQAPLETDAPIHHGTLPRTAPSCGTNLADIVDSVP